MNYRHAYHAGNFADVFKHVLFLQVITYLKRKPAPFRVIDTHAGAGLYELDSDRAAKTGEWREGIGRLLEADIPDELAFFFGPLFDTIRLVNGGTITGGIRRYPGSPVLAAELIRPNDVFIANELHPDDRQALERALFAYRNSKVTGVDGYVALKSMLPPKERRGVVLVDPPFEQEGELGRLVDGLREGARRFANGTFMLWFPIKDPRTVTAFERDLLELGLAKPLVVEFYVRAANSVERLNRHGLVVLNPPYMLADDLRGALPFLVRVLEQGDGARFGIDWLS